MHAVRFCMLVRIVGRKCQKSSVKCVAVGSVMSPCDSLYILFTFISMCVNVYQQFK